MSTQIIGKWSGLHQHKNICRKMRYLMYLKLKYNLRYKLGCNGKNQYKYRRYVPQNGVQKNYVPHVPQIGVQFGVQIRVHWEKSQNKALG